MKSHSSIDIYCVFVYIEQRAEELFTARYQSYFKKIVTINIQDEIYQKSFFEFSGFQAGLDLIIGNDRKHTKRVIFVNDTFINGHLTYASATVVMNVMRILRRENDNCLAGLCKQNLLVSSEFYVTTWCFGICISDCDAKRFDFLCGFRSQDELLKSSMLVDGDFREKVMTWLNPSSILRGWHNAPYFQKLERDKADRKLISIFLENCIPIHNEPIVGVPLRVTMTKHYIHDLNIKSALLLDRCYINYKKLLKRLLKL